MFVLMGKNVETMGLFFKKLSSMIRKDIGNGISGVPQSRFIMRIQINLHLVTKGVEFINIRLFYASFNDG